MQDIVAILGQSGATRYLQLVNSSTRFPCCRLRVLDEQGNTIADITNRLITGTASQSDEVMAQKATFTLDNGDGAFDRFGGGAYKDYLVNDAILYLESGLTDPANSHQYLLPTCKVRVSDINASGYARSGQGPTVEVTGLDFLKASVRQKATSPYFPNWQANEVARTIAKRFLRFTDSQIALAPLDLNYPSVQFPGMLIVDMLKRLFEPVLFYVRMSEDGRLVTGPRIGSQLSGLTNILGFADATAPPPMNKVAYTFPDSPFIEDSQSQWNDLNGTNQARVLGAEQNANVSLGPDQALSSKGDSTVDLQTTVVDLVYYSQHSAGSNDVLASNVWIDFKYSTNHHLDDAPRTAYWSINRPCKQGDTFDIMNEDPRLVGRVTVLAVSPNSIKLKMEGKQFSSGHAPARHHGGFDYNYTVHGSPLISVDQTLQAIVDYNAVAVNNELADDIFGDHQTFQLDNYPMAMGTPVQVFINGASQGVNAADQSQFSTLFKVDYEQGRVVLNNATYRNFSADSAASHQFSAGGAALINSFNWDLSALDTPTPIAIYQSGRTGESTFVFPGLSVGQGYSLRLHFGDAQSQQTYDGSGNNTVGGKYQRVFDVYVNGEQMLHDFDIFTEAGGNRPLQQTLEGVQPDFAGNITVRFLVHDPVTYAAFHPAPSSPSMPSGGWTVGNQQPSQFVPLVSGIEVLIPQGSGPPPYAVNAGGNAIAPAAPSVRVNYGYSPAQVRYGIQSIDINNPLIGDVANCRRVGQYYLNYAVWQRDRMPFKSAGSVPHLQAGDIVKFYHERLKADMYVYLQALDRVVGRQQANSDSYTSFVLFRSLR